MPGKNAFPRRSRLLKHAEFDAVYKKGRRHFSTSMTFFYQVDATAATKTARVGFTVGRVLGGAVERNRMKRRLRDAVRHHRAELDQRLTERGVAVEIVINPKKAVLTAETSALHTEVARAFKVIGEAKP
jgi:ribonuclease P protein component